MYRDFSMETLGSNPAATVPEPPHPMRNRRQRVRHKVHTPAYASLNGTSSAQVHDLSEIVDISEQGMAMQASSPLEVNRIVNLCLDLSETRASLHTTGEVIWSNRAGRVGIHFPQMPDVPLRRLKEWLFVNAIVACANYRAEQVPEIPRTRTDGLVGDRTAQAGALLEELAPPSPPDYTSVLAALAAVKREVELLGTGLDAALQLIASRAQVFTRASGAAIALTEGTEMICRASAGRDAPGLGARLKIGAGFSGECIRSGRLLRCEDSEVDPRADRESCRALGIRSMIAVPVRWGDAVIGLLEVFSPEPSAFSANDDVVLLRLAEVVAAAIHRAGSPEPSSPLPAVSVDDEFPVETPADIVLPQISHFRKILLASAAATVLLAVSWLLGPWAVSGRSGSARLPLRQASPALPKSPAATETVAAASNVEGLRRLAEQGDPIAQFAVGARYATGEDVPQDYTEAVRWFSLAAEQGHVVAQATLGAYYWACRGVPQDLVKAYLWSVLAQAGGDEASKYRVAVLASRMSRSQIVAAQQQANDWIKQHQQESRNSPVVR